MKTRHLLPLIAALAVLPCVAQSTNTPPHPPVQGPHSEGERDGKLEHALHEMQGMNPAQRAQFLENHPKLNQYLSNHPSVAKGITGASEAGTGVHDPAHPRVNEVNKREAKLDQRIAQGVANGTLTTQQAAVLDQKVEKIQHQESKDMEGDNGHLTGTETRQLNKEESIVSHAINHDGGKGGSGRGR